MSLVLTLVRVGRASPPSLTPARLVVQSIRVGRHQRTGCDGLVRTIRRYQYYYHVILVSGARTQPS